MAQHEIHDAKAQNTVINLTNRPSSSLCKFFWGTKKSISLNKILILRLIYLLNYFQSESSSHSDRSDRRPLMSTKVDDEEASV